MAYSSRILTPGAISSSFSSSSSNNHPIDQSPAGNYVYSPSTMSSSLGFFRIFSLKYEMKNRL